MCRGVPECGEASFGRESLPQLWDVPRQQILESGWAVLGGRKPARSGSS
jgi:hypothetical protein